MKTIFNIIAILFIVSCKAQAIQPLYPYGTDTSSNVNAESIYYKDVDNDFNRYVGTWKWENGSSSFTIIFNKVVHNNDGYGDYSDLLVGEYQYIENGVELVNTFPLIEPFGIPNIINQEDPWDNNIVSIIIAKVYRGIPPCSECDPNTRSIVMEFSEPSKPNLGGKLIMTWFEENGVEKIRVRIFNTYNLSNVDGVISIPENSIYTLIKQN